MKKVKRFREGTYKVGLPFKPYNKMIGAWIPEALMELPNLSPLAKLLYGRLCQHGGKDGLIFPSQETLAKELGVSVSTIKRGLNELKEAGFIGVVRTRKETAPKEQRNRYQTLFHPCLVEGYRIEEHRSRMTPVIEESYSSTLNPIIK